MAVLYGLHLTMIAGLNATLWRVATGPGFRPELMASTFPLLVFIVGTVVAAIAPQYAVYCWLLAFGALLLRNRARRSGDGA